MVKQAKNTFFACLLNFLGVLSGLDATSVPCKETKTSETDVKKTTAVNATTFAPIQILDHEIRSFLTNQGVDFENLEDAWEDMVWNEVLKPLNDYDVVKKARLIIEAGQELLAEHEQYKHLTEQKKLKIEQQVADAQKDIDALFNKLVWSWICSSALQKFYARISWEFNQVVRAWCIPTTKTSVNNSQLTSPDLIDLLETIGFKNYDNQRDPSKFSVGVNEDSVVLERDKLPDFTGDKSTALVQKILMLALSYFEPKHLLQRWKADDQAMLSFPLMRVDIVKSQLDTNVGLTLTAFPGAVQDAEDNGTSEENELEREVAKDEPWSWGKLITAGFLYGLQVVPLQLMCQAYEGVTTLWMGRSVQERNALTVLELSSSASNNDIRTQFQKLTLQYHPDKCTVEQKAAYEQKFEAIATAYRLLIPKNKIDSNN